MSMNNDPYDPKDGSDEQTLDFRGRGQEQNPYHAAGPPMASTSASNSANPQAHAVEKKSEKGWLTGFLGFVGKKSIKYPEGGKTSNMIGSSSVDQGAMFGEARGVDISGRQFYAADVQYIQVMSPNPNSEGEGKQSYTDRSSSPTALTRDEPEEERRLVGNNTSGRENETTALRNRFQTTKRKTSFEIFYEHISVQRRGSALWIPEPSKGLPMVYRRQGVAIGDVGVICESGSFKFLFNICLPREHPTNSEELPEDFTTVPLRTADVNYYSEFKGESYLSSATVKRSVHDGDSPGLTFESSASEGAILMMPVGSNSADVNSTGRFRKYTSAYGEDWYKYANNTREWEVRNGDLHLVIGYDKTKAWGMATFSNSTAHGGETQQGPRLLKFRPMEDSNVGKVYGWEYSGTAQARAGPDAHEIEELRAGDPSQDGMKYENQTLFVRTMNVTLQDDVWKKLAFNFGEVDVDDTPSTTKPDSHSSLPSRTPPAGNINMTATAVAGHPAKGINEMLLKLKPAARMAITEDYDWISVLKEDDHILPTTEELIRRIMISSVISQEGDIIFLEKIKSERDSDFLPAQQATRSVFVRWAVDPVISFKVLLLPVVLYVNWEVLALYADLGISNPFGNLFLLSGHIPTSSPDDPRYQKTWWDLAFLAYYVVFFSFVRQTLALKVSQPVAKYFELKRETKIDRFAEQTYALLYFAVSSTCGYFVMANLPTYWYRTNEFWTGYPHWDMKAYLKRYYLMQFSYWLQQLIVLVLGLEKPRKDYTELVAHHVVTLWLVGGSYLGNFTYIGSAVYMSMDIPDAFLALSKLLNYMQWNTAKVFAFGLLLAVWTYFRHYLNLIILWSVWYEEPNIPEWARRWSPSEGLYLPGWMRYQMFFPLLFLQILNLFWYNLMIKILIRGIISSQVDDDRSDDEDEGEEEEFPNEKED